MTYRVGGRQKLCIFKGYFRASKATPHAFYSRLFKCPELFSCSKHNSVILQSPHQACPFTSVSVSAYLILVFLNTLGNPVNNGVSVAVVAGGAVGGLILIAVLLYNCSIIVIPHV